MMRLQIAKIHWLVLLIMLGCVPPAFGSWWTKNDITLVISPYQDLAMMVNIHPLGLDKKYDTSVKINTIPWQDTLPTLASASGDVDIGFASLAEFLAKEENLNKGSSDPLLFIYPAYVFKGGAFVTFRDDLTAIYRDGHYDKSALKRFLSARIGLSKNTLYQMLVYQFAQQASLPVKVLRIVDIPFDEGLLAAEHGDLDVAAVGLTQLTEAIKRGGRVMFNMDDIGFADITGFVCKRSTLEKKRRHIENVIRMWFDATAFVMANLDHNSAHSLDYLKRNAATRYTIEEYKKALSQEYFPASLPQANADMIREAGKYYFRRLYDAVADFLEAEHLVSRRPSPPQFIRLAVQP